MLLLSFITSSLFLVNRIITPCIWIKNLSSNNMILLFPHLSLLPLHLSGSPSNKTPSILNLVMADTTTTVVDTMTGAQRSRYCGGHWSNSSGQTLQAQPCQGFGWYPLYANRDLLRRPYWYPILLPNSHNGPLIKYIKNENPNNSSRPNSSLAYQAYTTCSLGFSKIIRVQLSLLLLQRCLIICLSSTH